MIDALLYSLWRAMAYAFARTGHYERALHYFDRALVKRQSTVVSAYRAMALLLLGRKPDYNVAIRQVADALQSTKPDSEYARLYAQMIVAYLDDKLALADQLAIKLRDSECGRDVKELLLPMERPSLLAADSLLKAFGVEGGDPLEFRREDTGVHWMAAAKAYADLNCEQALEHVRRAEAAHPASPAQLVLKAALLLHLGQADPADTILEEVISSVENASSADERYLWLFCQIYRPSNEGNDKGHLLREAQALASESALRHFFPLDWSTPGGIKSHFDGLRAAYPNITVRPTPSSF